MVNVDDQDFVCNCCHKKGHYANKYPEAKAKAKAKAKGSKRIFWRSEWWPSIDNASEKPKSVLQIHAFLGFDNWRQW